MHCFNVFFFDCKITRFFFVLLCVARLSKNEERNAGRLQDKEKVSKDTQLYWPPLYMLKEKTGLTQVHRGLKFTGEKSKIRGGEERKKGTKKREYVTTMFHFRAPFGVLPLRQSFIDLEINGLPPILCSGFLFCGTVEQSAAYERKKSTTKYESFVFSPNTGTSPFQRK